MGKGIKRKDGEKRDEEMEVLGEGEAKGGRERNEERERKGGTKRAIGRGRNVGGGRKDERKEVDDMGGKDVAKERVRGKGGDEGRRGRKWKGKTKRERQGKMKPAS